MGNNKTSYQTNFSGVKYSNNPLTTDINSFSNANNVYLNKYNALISRPPINAQEYPWQAYGNEALPIYLILVAKYNLSNSGEVYVVLDTNATPNLYRLRYKSPAGVYSSIITSVTITDFTKFSLVQYKQYYIMFTTDGARVLDTTDPTNVWEALSEYVDIPITIIQTGNEILELDGNELTAGYKKQYVVKPDSDDSIYNLPEGETATVVFPSQTDTTYDLTLANEYTRSRLMRGLNTPANYDTEAIISMADRHIAIAHSDRVDISLDYGETFQTIVYPTVSSADYKNTASLSDDGLYFFYVHTDGVYRYELGAIYEKAWTLIEVTLEPSYDFTLVSWGAYTTEREVQGVAIGVSDVGANYCHFVNAEKFIFMLAHYRAVEDDYISVVYAKGLNLTNLYDNGKDGDPVGDFTKLNSFATVLSDSSQVPFNIITDLTSWEAYPYTNNRNSLILDNNTIAFYMKNSSNYTGLIVKASRTHVYRDNGSWISRSIPYITYKIHSTTSGDLVNEITPVATDKFKLLIKNNAHVYFSAVTLILTLSEYIDSDDEKRKYTLVFTTGVSATTLLNGVAGASGLTDNIYKLDDRKYISNGKLLIVDDSNTLSNTYTLVHGSPSAKVITSGPYFISFDASTQKWYTNLPLLATLTYTYLSAAEFTQVPKAFFHDQNLWLAMNKTLWIGNLIDDKLSVLPINSNKFSKEVTGIIPISATSKAIFFIDSITLCEQSQLSDGSVIWYYYPLKFSVGVRNGDSVITTNDGKLTVFPTKFGLAALTYQLDIAATEQAITYLSDDIKTMWSEFYKASSAINILHSNTQLILSNGTNQVLLYDFRTNGWYPLNFPTLLKISRVQANADNYELLELQPADAEITSLTNLYELNKEADELYTYATPYKDLSTTVIPWHLTSQLLLLEAPNNYKNISQVMIDQIDSAELKQSAYFTAQIFRQRANIVKPSIELIYDIDTFAKIVKKVNWWKVLGFKWQLENDASSSYPTQLRLYNISISYDISYEVK